jgi:hexosaminidase
MGGDEAPNGVWERLPAAQPTPRQHGLASARHLWFVFYGKVEQILKAHGIPLSGWEEIAVRKTRRRPGHAIEPGASPSAAGARGWNNVPGWGPRDSPIGSRTEASRSSCAP